MYLSLAKFALVSNLCLACNFKALLSRIDCKNAANELVESGKCHKVCLVKKIYQNQHSTKSEHGVKEVEVRY